MANPTWRSPTGLASFVPPRYHKDRGICRSERGGTVRLEDTMADHRPGSFMKGSFALYGPYLGAGLAILALVLLAAGPLGWRAGWWHFRFAFTWLMTCSAYVAIAAA